MLPCKKSCFLSPSSPFLVCRSLMQNITSMPIKTYISSFISVQISIRQNLQKWRTLMHFLIVFNWRCHLIMLEPWQFWLCAMYCAFAKKLFALVQKNLSIEPQIVTSTKYKYYNLAKITSCWSRVYTVWKFHYFCITEILCEINFEDSRNAKSAVFAILGAVNFVHFLPSKSAKIHKNQNSEPLNVVKWLILHFKNLQNWFHVKSELYKNREISSLWGENFCKKIREISFWKFFFFTGCEI